MSYTSAYLSPPPRRPDRKISRVTHLIACLERQIRCGTLYPARSEKSKPQGKTIGRAEYLRDSCPVLCVGYTLYINAPEGCQPNAAHTQMGRPTHCLPNPRGTYASTHTHTHTSPTGKGAHAPGQGRAKALSHAPAPCHRRNSRRRYEYTSATAGGAKPALRINLSLQAKLSPY